MRSLLTLALVGALCAPALADNRFTCEDGSTMEEIDDVEIIISRPGDMAISLPYVGVTTEYTWWSPDMQSWGCTKAPCAMHWYTKGEPETAFYMLDAGREVRCTPEGQ